MLKVSKKPHLFPFSYLIYRRARSDRRGIIINSANPAVSAVNNTSVFSYFRNLFVLPFINVRPMKCKKFRTNPGKKIEDRILTSDF